MKRAAYTFLILTILSISYCGKKEKSSEKSQMDKKTNETSKTKTETKIKTKYISAKGGLRMRDKPDTTGAKLGTIPTGTKVDLLEETGKAITIAGTTGKWSKIKWGEKTGWVFGGFLTVENPGGKMLKEFSGDWRAEDKGGNKIDYSISEWGLEFQETASENQYSQESWQLVMCYRGKGFKSLPSLFCQFKEPNQNSMETMEFQKFTNRHIGIIRGYEGKEYNYANYNPDIVFEKD